MGPEELDAVRAVFESNWLGKGQRTEEFESRLAERFAVARTQVRSTSCCTAGLFLIGELLGWKPGTDVVLPTISFVGAANAVASRGARPVFADVDPRTLNLTAAHLMEALTAETRAVVLLHYGGVPCADIDEIIEICQERKIALIEDNACSPFSKIEGRACGTLGDFGVWSFDAMKILVTGDGGLVYVKNGADAIRLERLAYLGLESASGSASGRRDRWWDFEISCFGGRQILNDISAAIGLEQLKKVDKFLARRREVHEFYQRQLSSLSWLQCPDPIPAEVTSSYYFYWVQTELRDALAKWLLDRRIYTTFRYAPLHTVKLYGSDAHLRAAEWAADRTLCLPLHQSLRDEDLEYIVDNIRHFPH